MTLTYEDQVVIGTAINTAIERVLREYQIYDHPDLIGALAQAVLIQLNQTGYQITKQ
jgi:hypothetical protein